MIEQRTAYDEIPYESFPYSQSHPTRLATIATLFGMSPPKIDSCRVLELGCAAGGNLIPVAVQFPKSQFIGIDLSGRQIAAGQNVVDKLGLTNTKLLNQSITDIGPEMGKFDYIICHGVWSWVPPNVRKKILQVCHEQLAQNGVAFVSYNTYPGWHLRGIVRDMMIFHSRKFKSAKERVGNARGLLDFLIRNVPEEKNAYGMLLRNEMEILRGKDDGYIAHEHLEEENEPVYFHEFAEQANAAGLQYLGEAELRSMSNESFAAETNQILGKIAANVIEYEQYMDFLRNRTFRQTLLCHLDQPINRKVDPDRITDLYVGSPAIPEGNVVPHDNSEAKFRGGPGTITTSSPMFKLALKLLGEIWPRAMSFQDLSAKVRGQIYGDGVLDAARVRNDMRSLGSNLIDCFVRKFVDLYAADPGCTNEPGNRPRANPLVRLQAEVSGVVYSGMHVIVGLNELQRHVAQLADGQHTLDDILDGLVSKAKSGGLVVQQAGETVTDDAQIRLTMSEALDQTLKILARQALLVPSDG